MSLSKQKEGKLANSLQQKQINSLKSLDGNGKPIDKNVKLLRAMLELFEVDLSQEQCQNDFEKNEENSEHDLQSISFKDIKIEPKIIKMQPINNLSGIKRSARIENRQSRFKRIKIEDAFEKEKSYHSDQDDVDFHEIPTKITEFTGANMMDKKDRSMVYQKIYHKRREQQLNGKRKQKLGIFTKLIFSYPRTEEVEIKKEVAFCK
jgi:hypothetical protein